MDKKEEFPEQKAPEKNTDQAFIQVGKDGNPVTLNASSEKQDDPKRKIASPESKK